VGAAPEALRAVLDPNVIVSALLSPRGTPARLLVAWSDGEFELLVSPALLMELERVIAYPKLRRRIASEDEAQVLLWLREEATLVHDPDRRPSITPEDPGDDYLVALAEGERAALVSGDRHLLALADRLPIFAPRAFLELLEERRP
jgi:putative PIN family toxin of toxin-antitoxin system